MKRVVCLVVDLPDEDMPAAGLAEAIAADVAHMWGATVSDARDWAADSPTGQVIAYYARARAPEAGCAEDYQPRHARPRPSHELSLRPGTHARIVRARPCEAADLCMNCAPVRGCGFVYELSNRV